MINNEISGKGYVPTSNACIVAMTGTEICPIDTASSTAAKVHANNFSP